VCTIEKANVAINKLVQEGRLGKHMQRLNTRQMHQARLLTYCFLQLTIQWTSCMWPSLGMLLIQQAFHANAFHATLPTHAWHASSMSHPNL